MQKKVKFLIGILAVLFCAFLGCKEQKQQEESLLILSEEPEASPIVEEMIGEGLKERLENSIKVVQEEQFCVVHICGAVENPGVFTFSAGSRIYQAIEKAGGFRQDAAEDYLNQADLLSDSMKIYVPTLIELEELPEISMISSGDVPAKLPETSDQEGQAMSGLVNINQADEAMLCTLPGIGNNKALSIIEYRQTNGDYQKIEDIMQVAGIKEGLFQKIKDKITV